MKYYRSLTDLLQRHFSIHQARLGFMARFTLALFMQSTVSFPKLALVLSRGAKPASNERRIQRFMSGYTPDLCTRQKNERAQQSAVEGNSFDRNTHLQLSLGP